MFGVNKQNKVFDFGCIRQVLGALILLHTHNCSTTVTKDSSGMSVLKNLACHDLLGLENISRHDPGLLLHSLPPWHVCRSYVWDVAAAWSQQGVKVTVYFFPWLPCLWSKHLFKSNLCQTRCLCYRFSSSAAGHTALGKSAAALRAIEIAECLHLHCSSLYDQ